MSATPHPWHRLGATFPDVPVLRAELASPHVHAETRWCDGRPVAIVLHRELTQVQARCAIAHEHEHLTRGAPCGSLRARIERQVTIATAHYLLPDVDTMAAALAVDDLRQAADELWVTHDVLLDRLGCLTPRERAVLSRAIESGRGT